jgi:hypothetical protein
MTQYPFCRRVGGPQSQFGWVQKFLPPTSIQSPHCPACSKLLYQLHHSGPHTILAHHCRDIPQQNLFFVQFDISTVQKSPGQWTCGSWGSVFRFWFCYVLFWWIYCQVQLWIIWRTWSSSERWTWHSEAIISKTLHWLRHVAGFRNLTL